MKNLILSIIGMAFALQGNAATAPPLDSIKNKVVSFYKEIADYRNYDDISVDVFLNFMMNKKIEEGEEGIFYFSLKFRISSGEIYHHLLIEKDNVEILNMYDPIEENILKLTAFLARDKRYTKEDVLFYIEDIIDTHRENEEYLKSFDGLIY